MDLPIDYEKTLTTLFHKKAVRNTVIATAIALNLSPIFCRDILNRNAKFALSLFGVGFAVACCKLPEYDYEEKLKKTYEETDTKLLATEINGKISYHRTKQEIDNKRKLGGLIENLPEHQINSFAAEYGVSDILPQYYIEAEGQETAQPVNQTIKVDSSVFKTQIDAKQAATDSDISWLKKAVVESVFIAGKKGSGKSHLMRWLLSAWLGQATEKDLFYVIDKHFDEDVPWVNGLPQSLVSARISDGSTAIARIKELHNTLLNRIKNKLTLNKTQSKVRVWIDEVDAYSPDELEKVIAPFIKDIENQGRKYGYSAVIGAHSIKKGEMGIDSSVTGSMLQVLFPSVVLDKNSVLSGVFPSVTTIRNQIERYKSEYKNCRVVAICEDDEFYISHIPDLELPKFEVKEAEPVDISKSPYDLIILWCKNVKEKDGRYPNKSELKRAWEHETGKVLDNDKGLKLLIEYLSKFGI